MPSTVVKSMHYNASTSTLRIVFVSGLIYEYKDVPEKIYESMKAASSKGSYLNQYIKNNYDFEKIGE